MTEARYHDVADNLRGFYLRTHRLLDAALKAKGASFAQLKLLLFIEYRDSVRSTDICDTLGYAPRTVTEAVDALERDGLVRREPDPNDRRAKNITLTEAGQEAVRKAEPLRDRFFEKVFGTLDATEIGELLRLTGKLNDRLDVLSEPLSADHTSSA